MSERVSRYRPESEYAYPWPYNASEDETLDRLDYPEYQFGIPGTLAFSPQMALMKWVISSPGHWQARQAARYPGFHRDLDSTLIPEVAAIKESEFRHDLLEMMTFETARPGDDTPNRDFHPIGHMARVAYRLQQLLYPALIAPKGAKGDPFMLDVIRHSAALHDTGEAEHPGVVINHGSAVGDISAAVGKTDTNRTQERAILDDVLKDIFSEEYSVEFREAMVKIISHDTYGENKSFVLHHSVIEAAHHLNSADTGTYLGEKAPTVDPAYGNFMTLLAEQHGKVLRPKFQEIFDHSPELKESLGVEVKIALNRLDDAIHCRDENEEWIEWRTSSKIVETFGEYETWEF